jgi:hypothetical protein
MNEAASVLAGLLLGAFSIYALKRTLEGFLIGDPSRRAAAWSVLAGLRMLLTAAALFLLVRAGAEPAALGAGIAAAYLAFKIAAARAGARSIPKHSEG